MIKECIVVMQVCLRLCNALKCIVEATITVRPSKSVAKLARIAIKFGICLFKLTNIYIYTTYN